MLEESNLLDQENLPLGKSNDQRTWAAIGTMRKQEKGQKDPRQEGLRGRTEAKTKPIGVPGTPESECQTLGAWGKTRSLRLSDHP